MATPPRRRLVLLLILLAVSVLQAIWYHASSDEPTMSAAAAASTPGSAPTLEAPSLMLGAGGATLIQVASLDFQITDIQHAGDGSGRIFVADRVGRVLVLSLDAPEPRLFLDLRDRVRSDESERGLLGLAFAPDYAVSGALYVNYTGSDGQTVVSRFRTEPGAASMAARGEAKLLEFAQPYWNHNGGQIRFGPDGMLWIASGDGGAGGDPSNHAQNPASLLGKLLRIDVSDEAAIEGLPYDIPPGNRAVVGEDDRPEIWALGLRNPWRFAFDAAGEQVWIADVGQNAWEEVNRVAVTAPEGGWNFGWRVFEGTRCFAPEDGCSLAGHAPPIYEYPHPEGCSVTGGVVVPAGKLPGLDGAYLIADFCGGWIRALQPTADGVTMRELFNVHGALFSTFGTTEEGDVLVADLRGGLYRLGGGG